MIGTVTAVDLRWLCEIAPHYYDLDNFPKGEARVSASQLITGERSSNST